MNPTRRTVAASLIFATPAFLVACTPAQVLTTADLITAGVAAFAPVLRPLVSSDQQSLIDKLVPAIQAADTALGTATGQNATLNAETIVADVQVIAPIAISLLVRGTTGARAAEAALSLLPAILREFGLPSPPAVPAAPGAVAATVGPPMSEDEARAFLSGLVAARK